MKHRPLCTVCLLWIFLLAAVVWGGREKAYTFFSPTSITSDIEDNEKVLVTGAVCKKEFTENRQSYYLKNVSIYSYSKERSLKESQIVIYDRNEKQKNICYGNVIEVAGKLKYFDDARNPGNFDQKAYYERQKIHVSVWADKIKLQSGKENEIPEKLWRLKMAWKEMLIKVLGEEKGGVLSAMLLGDKSAMDPELKELYKVNGIAHILAISGLHLSFLGVGFYRLLRRASGSYLCGGVGGIIILSLYVLLVGKSVSTERAFVMFLFRVGADITGRKYDSQTALAVAAVCVLTAQPLYLYDAAFFMSFGAVLSMLLVYPVFDKLPMQNVWAGISTQILLLPVLLMTYFEVPLLSIGLNLLVIPLLTLLLMLAATASVFWLFFQPATWLLLKCCSVILIIYEKSCSLALLFPWARLTIGRPKIWQCVIYYLLVGMFLVLVKKNKGKTGPLFFGLLAIIVLVCPQNAFRGTNVTMIDVGQGECIFIRTSAGKAYLYDGGSSDVKNAGQYRIEPFLKSQGVGKLDGVFVSHGDEDHMNGILEMLERQKVGIKIKRLLLPPMSVWDDGLYALAQTGQKYDTKICIMKPGEKLDGFVCLGPNLKETGKKNIEAGNEASLILALPVGKRYFLFTGDVEGSGEEQLTRTLRQLYPNMRWDFLAVAHHGSKNSTTDAFLEAANPKYALISAGRKNRYGHPNEETLHRLSKHGCKYVCTAQCGAVSIRLANEKAWLTRWLPSCYY